ncbi:MAG: polysaccharide deacetylase family protein [Rhizobium sp.]|jgi:peptidoglycan/xylan/chitin deacetylase (PgdA/CDA1 family)|uniref:polysaccharide deacetylase family protein n=1 Tax=Thiobacillus sp. TaxID=924 RepID=UPI0025D03D7B|nr:polysaccharide deacetylase family protein [Thiobacillus sp.]MBW8364359.1 polysaccharide deacetylase family protein [Rhizobium sp.]
MTWVDPLSRALHNQAGQHGPIMLMYHAVTPGKGAPAWPWAVSMQQFRDQLDFLVMEGYATPTMGELVSVPAEKWTGRTAVITFDDGYVDNLAACEELQKRGMRATWFIVSGSVGLPPRWPADGRPPGRLLNPVELCSMQESGMEIGSHTVSHVRLTEVDDPQLMHELTDSKSKLEDILGNTITSFAYPYGAWDERCAAAVEQAGYVSACTTRTGWALRDNSLYKLRRLTVFNTDTVGSLARKQALATNDGSWRAMLEYMLKRFRR